MSASANPNPLRNLTKRLVERADEMGKPPDAAGYPKSRMLGTLASIERISPMLARVAEQEYAVRRLREKVFPKQLFFDPVWDMLLDLYIRRVKGRRVSVTSLCYASSVPSTTALRYIRELENKKFINRLESQHDKRVNYLEISDQAFVSMSILLEQHLNNFKKFELPASE